MALTASQKKLAKKLVRIGRQEHASKKQILAALATARVEANFSNPKHATDHDSLGWRQERQMYYKNPTNVEASARRFYKELPSGGKIGQMAQSAQGSAYPSRYGDAVPEARRILKSFGGSKGGGKGGDKGKAQKVKIKKAGEVKNKTIRSQSKSLEAVAGKDNSAIRQQLLQTYILSDRRPGSLLDLAYQMRGAADTPGGLKVNTRNTKSKVPVQKKGKLVTKKGQAKDKSKGGGSGDKGHLPHLKGAWGGTQRFSKTAAQTSKKANVPISSRKRQSTLGNPSSDHYVGNKNAYAIDLDTAGNNTKQGISLAKKIAKRYGVKFKMNSYSSGGTVKTKGGSVRIQILYGSGIDHGDHVHVGFRRA